MDDNTRVWDVYAKQLFHFGYGHPLWEPELKQGSGEVLIGDVGYLLNGGFYRIFNATKDAENPIQVYGIPEEFERIDLGPMVPTGTPKVIEQGPMFSQSVKELHGRLGVTG